MLEFNPIMKSIVLIGFMGAGKSLIAKELQRRLPMMKFSTDKRIEAKEKMLIPDIFKTHGEAYFRQAEALVVKELSEKEGVIIDCGGGVILDPQNIKSLKQNGIVFYLSARLEVIYDRIKNSKNRPLIQGQETLKKIEELLKQRQPLYEQAADVVVDANDKSIEGPVNKILEVIKQ